MIEFKKNLLTSALMAATLSAAPLTLYAADDTPAVKRGEASLSFRYRYEMVDQENFSKDANASSLRTRLNYKTADYNGWQFFIEADNVTEIWGDHYNAAAGNTPDRTQYPVVAVPTSSTSSWSISVALIPWAKSPC